MITIFCAIIGIYNDPTRRLELYRSSLYDYRVLLLYYLLSTWTKTEFVIQDQLKYFSIRFESPSRVVCDPRFKIVPGIIDDMILYLYNIIIIFYSYN